MANTVQDILRMLRDEEIQMVDFKMVDIHGQYRHVTIPAENFSEDMMTDGLRRLQLRLRGGGEERHGVHPRS